MVMISELEIEYFFLMGAYYLTLSIKPFWKLRLINWVEKILKCLIRTKFKFCLTKFTLKIAALFYS